MPPSLKPKKRFCRKLIFRRLCFAIAGHEGSGVVIEVGSDVSSVQAGDSVLLSFASCAACHFCRTGHPVGCVTWVERNFGRVRDEAVGARGVATGAGGNEVLGESGDAGARGQS